MPEAAIAASTAHTFFGRLEKEFNAALQLVLMVCNQCAKASPVDI